ncbi:MAG: NADH-quinone oxidoreductase subunit C [Acidobacteria bacterium]|nr:MAG: NADH-quinone oxidoreductase subunit C [Acidobacteriota bacterium]
MGVETSAEKQAAAGLLELLREKFPEDVLEGSTLRRENTAVIRREALIPVVEFLRNDSRLEFDLLIDLTAVDYLGRRPRFDVVYHLLSLSGNRRIRLKVRVDEGDAEVPSLSAHWGCADWLEREVWDMFGIRFTGHPNLKRLLMYEEFRGHPLRKDYPIQRRQPLIGPKDA